MASNLGGMGPYTSQLDTDLEKHQVRPCDSSSDNCDYPPGSFPLQQEVLRFASVARLSGMTIDFLISVEPDSEPYTPVAPQRNMVTAGGIVRSAGTQALLSLPPAPTP